MTDRTIIQFTRPIPKALKTLRQRYQNLQGFGHAQCKWRDKHMIVVIQFTI